MPGSGRRGAFMAHDDAPHAGVDLMRASYQAGYSAAAAGGAAHDAYSAAVAAGAPLGPESLALNPDALEARIAAIPESVGISAREAQIMSLFAQGRSANWIAEDLIISKNTVRSHIRSIYTKLDVHSRKELLEKLAQG